MHVGTLASQASCRDNGQGWADVGALCLSWAEMAGYAHHGTLTESQPDQDKHKAPALPHIRPLSLQKRRKGNC